MLKEYDLNSTTGRKISGAIISSLFILLGVLTMLKILDFKFLLNAWQDSVLYKYVPTEKSAIIYVIIGVVFLIVTFIPSKYSKIKVYSDSIRIYRGEEEKLNLQFSKISNIAVTQKSKGDPKHLIINFIDENEKTIDLPLLYKSDIGEYIKETYDKYTENK